MSLQDRFASSRAQHERAKATLARGVSSAIRATQEPVPLCFERGSGARLWDLDDNVYVDYALSYGPMLLGHSPSSVLDAVREQLREGIAFGASHRHEAELSEILVRLIPSAEMCVFSNSGTEAVQVALRIARAATGRTKVIKFLGHYHGWADSVNLGGPGQARAEAGTAGQDAGAVASVTVCAWNDLSALEAALSGDVAAVIMEPINVNGGCLVADAGYLDAAVAATRAAGALMIFDEVITGFRLSLGGAQEALGVLPDLTVLGKALGAGFPISAVCGRAEIMAVVASGEVAHMGTSNANPVCVRAAVAALRDLEKHADIYYPALRAGTIRLGAIIVDEAARGGLTIQVNTQTGVGHAFVTDDKVESYEDTLKSDVAAYHAFAGALAREGVHVTAKGLMYVSTAHTDDDFLLTQAAVRRATTTLQGFA